MGDPHDVINTHGDIIRQRILVPKRRFQRVPLKHISRGFQATALPAAFEDYDVTDVDGRISVKELLRVTGTMENMMEAFAAFDRDGRWSQFRQHFVQEVETRDQRTQRTHRPPRFQIAWCKSFHVVGPVLESDPLSAPKLEFWMNWKSKVRGRRFVLPSPLSLNRGHFTERVQKALASKLQYVQFLKLWL